MARTAILYGLYSNLPAMRAVVNDAGEQLVDRYVCLGDVTCAGPFPYECLQWVHETCDWCFTGYWDRCLSNPSLTAGSSAIHRNETSVWNREAVLKYPDGHELIQYMSSQPYFREEGDVLFLHGSVTHPKNGFLPDTCSPDNPRFFCEQAEKEYAALQKHIRLCFVGHIGLPCVIWPDGMLEHESAISRTFGEAGNERAIINVGSVGLPQDHDPRACYVIFDDETMTFIFRRIAYDMEELIEAFRNAVNLSIDCRNWMIQRHHDGI